MEQEIYSFGYSEEDRKRFYEFVYGLLKKTKRFKIGRKLDEKIQELRNIEELIDWYETKRLKSINNAEVIKMKCIINKGCIKSLEEGVVWFNEIIRNTIELNKENYDKIISEN